jgi:hypothetical protein
VAIAEKIRIEIRREIRTELIWRGLVDDPRIENARRYWQERLESRINAIYGFVSGEGCLAGRMASGAPGAIDPTEEFREIAELYSEKGLTTRGAIAAEYSKSFFESGCLEARYGKAFAAQLKREIQDRLLNARQGRS